MASNLVRLGVADSLGVDAMLPANQKSDFMKDVKRLQVERHHDAAKPVYKPRNRSKRWHREG